MYLNPDYIPDEALTAILNRLDLDESDESYKQISKLTPREAFNLYLNYIGLFGFTDKLIAAWTGLQEAYQNE